MLGARLVHPLQPLELLASVLGHFGRHLCLLDLLLQLVDLDAGVLVFTQLLLQLPQLLAQHGLTLALTQRRLRLLGDVAGDLQHLEPVRQHLEHLVQALLQIQGLEHLLLFLGLHVHEADDQVGQAAGRLNGLNRPRQLAGHLRQQRQGLDGARLENLGACLDLRPGRVGFRQRLDARGEIRPLVCKLLHTEPALALGNEVMRSIRRGHITDDRRQHTDLMQIV